MSALKKASKRLAGAALLVVGVPLLVLPGPGIPLVLGGLMLLAPEAPWVKRLIASSRGLARSSVELLRRR